MSFQISAELRYSVQQPSTILLCLHALPTPNQKLSSESFVVTEGATYEFFPLQIGQNRYVRIQTGNLPELTVAYEVTAETNPGARQIQDIDQVPVASLQEGALPFLFPSRYCQSDRLGRLAMKLSQDFSHPLAKVASICDWLYENVEYVPGLTDPSTSACDTLVQRAGVCRDFAHLGIALSRAISIPARYFSGYACNMLPQDFHACFEVCVGNHWFIFDPTRLAPLNGLVRISSGRDAADSAVATIFGSVALQSLRVECHSQDFQPLHTATLQGKAILLEP